MASEENRALEENGSLARQEVENRSEFSLHGSSSSGTEVIWEGYSNIDAGSRGTSEGRDLTDEATSAGYLTGYEDAITVAKNLGAGTVCLNFVDELEACSDGEVEIGPSGEVELVNAPTSSTWNETGKLSPAADELNRTRFAEHVFIAAGQSHARSQEDDSQNSLLDLHGEVARAVPLPSEPINTEALHKDGLPQSWKDVEVLKTPSSAPGGQCTIYIVGTAHVSSESCKEVANVIQTIKPQVVFIELCSSRLPMLMQQTLQIPTVAEMLALWRSKKMNALGIIYAWFLTKISAKLEVLPGSEFRVAYEGAMACGAKVTLGDRPVQITLRRTWTKMSLWEKTTLMYCLVFRSLFLPSAEELSVMVEELKDSDMVTRTIQELGKRLPTVMETLILERDLYMTAMLQLVAKEYTTVVAVVGKGHVPGITQSWDKTISVESLMVVPNKTSGSRPLWGLLAISVGAVAIMSAVYCSRRR